MARRPTVYQAEQAKQQAKLAQRAARSALATVRNIQADVDAVHGETNAKYERQRARFRANALSRIIGDLQHAREHLMTYSDSFSVLGERLDDARRWMTSIEATIEEMDVHWQAESDAATGAHSPQSAPITPTLQSSTV